MIIYILHTDNSLSRTTFYTKRELARKVLKKKRDEIIRRNVNITCDSQDKFSFYFGWEEHGATWRIDEITVLEK